MLGILIRGRFAQAQRGIDPCGARLPIDESGGRNCDVESRESAANIGSSFRSLGCGGESFGAFLGRREVGGNV
jgi:hypothetical protein